jgi:hypothetical protein
MLKRLAAALAALALGLPASAQVQDAAGVTVFPEGMAGQTLAMAQYDVVASELGLTPVDAAHASAKLVDPVLAAVFATLNNKDSCEIIKPGNGEPAWDGFCSSDQTLEVCDAAGCYGTKDASSAPGAVFEILGFRFAPDQTSADVYASMGWEGKDRKVRLAWFHYVVKSSGGKWKVESAQNLRSGSPVKLPK